MMSRLSTNFGFICANIEALNSIQTITHNVSSITCNDDLSCIRVYIAATDPKQLEKIIVEGEMTVQEVGGETVNVSPGDVLFFPKGTSTIFTSKSSGLGFYCGQRKQGEL